MTSTVAGTGKVHLWVDGVPRLVALKTCPICGALVPATEEAVHADWHRQQS